MLYKMRQAWPQWPIRRRPTIACAYSNRIVIIELVDIKANNVTVPFHKVPPWAMPLGAADGIGKGSDATAAPKFAWAYAGLVSPARHHVSYGQSYGPSASGMHSLLAATNAWQALGDTRPTEPLRLMPLVKRATNDIPRGEESGSEGWRVRREDWWS